MTDLKNDNNRVPSANDGDIQETELLAWTTHPLRKRPVVSIIVTLFILGTSMLIFWIMQSEGFTLLALVVLFASLAKFYLPTRFRLTDKRVIIKSTTQTIAKPWSMFRSFYPDKNGLLLSPFVEPSRLENFRGMYLIFSDNRQAVIDTVDKQIANNAETAPTPAQDK